MEVPLKYCSCNIFRSSQIVIFMFSPVKEHDRISYDQFRGQWLNMFLFLTTQCKVFQAIVASPSHSAAEKMTSPAYRRPRVEQIVCGTGHTVSVWHEATHQATGVTRVHPHPKRPHQRRRPKREFPVSAQIWSCCVREYNFSFSSCLATIETHRPAFPWLKVPFNKHWPYIYEDIPTKILTIYSIVLTEPTKKRGTPSSSHHITFADADREKEVSEEKRNHPQEGDLNDTL